MRYARGGGLTDERRAFREKWRMATLGARLVFEDEADFSLVPPATRTWSRRGHIPVVRVRGRSRRRLSVAALVCRKPRTLPTDLPALPPRAPDLDPIEGI